MVEGASSSSGDVKVSDFLASLDPSVRGIADDIFKEAAVDAAVPDDASPSLVKHQEEMSAFPDIVSRKMVEKTKSVLQAITNGDESMGVDPTPSVREIMEKFAKATVLTKAFLNQFAMYGVPITPQLHKACEALADTGIDLDACCLLALTMESVTQLLPSIEHLSDRATLAGACKKLLINYEVRTKSAEKEPETVPSALNLAGKPGSTKPKVSVNIPERMEKLGLAELPLEHWPQRKLVDALQAAKENDPIRKGMDDSVPYTSFPLIKLNGKLVYDQLLNWSSKMSEDSTSASFTDRIDESSATPPIFQLLDKEARKNCEHPYREENMNQYEHLTLVLRLFLALSVCGYFDDRDVSCIILTHLARIFTVGVSHGSFTTIRFILKFSFINT